MVGAAAPTAATAIAPRGRGTRPDDPRRVLAIAAALGGAGAPRRRARRRSSAEAASDAQPPTTVVRTTTVAGEPQVRTVTVEAQPATPPDRRATDAQPVSAPPSSPRERGRAQRPGVPAAPGAATRPPRCRFSSGGRRAPGLRLAGRGVRVVQPRPRPVLDRRLHRRQGPARQLEADPGRARREIKELGHEVDKGCKR